MDCCPPPPHDPEQHPGRWQWLGPLIIGVLAVGFSLASLLL